MRDVILHPALLLRFYELSDWDPRHRGISSNKVALGRRALLVRTPAISRTKMMESMNPGKMLFALLSVKLVLQWIHGDEHEAVIAVLARKMDDECQHAPLGF